MAIARSSFYSQQKPTLKKVKDTELSKKIEQIQKAYFFTIGRRRMGTLLQKEFGIDVGEGQIHRVMKTHHLSAQIRQIKKTKPHAGKAYQGSLPENILDRQFEADAPLQKLVTDVTYVPYYEHGEWHWGYLSLVQDLFDRSIVAWVFARKQDISLSLKTLQILSFRGVKPGAMLHSDRGSIYTATIFRETLSRMGVKQSFSRRGNCHDNATMECFNGTFKVEALYNKLWSTERPNFMEQNTLIANYVDFYNNKRPCSVIGNMTPNEYKSKFLEYQKLTC